MKSNKFKQPIEDRRRLLGWVVPARKRNKHDQLSRTFTNVSAPLEVREAAQAFLELWKQKHPRCPAHIVELVREPKRPAKKKGKAIAAPIVSNQTQREIF